MNQLIDPSTKLINLRSELERINRALADFNKLSSIAATKLQVMQTAIDGSLKTFDIIQQSPEKLQTGLIALSKASDLLTKFFVTLPPQYEGEAFAAQRAMLTLLYNFRLHLADSFEREIGDRCFNDTEARDQEFHVEL